MNTLLKSLMPAVMALAALSCYAQEPMRVDPNGYYNLLDAPQTSAKFKAKSTQNGDGTFTTKIYKGKKLVQTIKHEATSGEVRFVDMNYDGSVDLFVGPASPRTYSTIFLYNKKTGKFVPTEPQPSLNGHFLVNDSKKLFVSMGSDGASSALYQKFTFNGNRLTTTQSLMVFYDPSVYADYDVTTKYTLIKGDDYYGPGSVGCVIVRTNTPSELPKEWQQIISSFDNM